MTEVINFGLSGLPSGVASSLTLIKVGIIKDLKGKLYGLNKDFDA